MAEDDDDKYSLGQPAHEVYTNLSRGRESVVSRAREIASITIPSAFPPQGYVEGDVLNETNQSLNAFLVNNLASRLMFMAFPPGRPILRFEIVEDQLQAEADADPALWSKIRLALSLKELEHRRRAATTPLLTAYVGLMRQLLVAGNALWHQVDIDSPTFHRCDTYVVKRNRKGHPLITVLEEITQAEELEPEFREFVYRVTPELKDKKLWEREVHVYTVCRLHVGDGGERTWCYWQEYDGKKLPDTELEADYDEPPMWPAWMVPNYGGNWGVPYCEEYRGDLYTVENLSSSLNDGASLAALALLLVRPGSATSVKQVKEAENLSVIAARAEDITGFRLDKGSDFQFVSGHLETVARRLSRAFLSQQGIQRDAERVTAEEWRRLGQELDMAMGGLYTELAQTTQRLVVMRFVRLHEEDDPRMVALPEDIIRISVVTSVDALGSTSEEEQLVGLVGTMGQLVGPEVVAKTINVLDLWRRLAAEKGIQPQGLVKDEQQIAAETQQATQMGQMQTLLEKGTAPVAGVAAEAMAGQLSQPQQQSQE